MELSIRRQLDSVICLPEKRVESELPGEVLVGRGLEL